MHCAVHGCFVCSAGLELHTEVVGLDAGIVRFIWSEDLMYIHTSVYKNGSYTYLSAGNFNCWRKHSPWDVDEN